MYKTVQITFAGIFLLSACQSQIETGKIGEKTRLLEGKHTSEGRIAHVEDTDAYQQLLKAAKKAPNDKTPWVQMAKMSFDAKDYGHAILYAHEALKRDPADNLATSIAAVSGLRVSSKALTVLRETHSFNLNAESEAAALAKLLQTNLGEPVLAPQTTRRQTQ